MKRAAVPSLLMPLRIAVAVLCLSCAVFLSSCEDYQGTVYGRITASPLDGVPVSVSPDGVIEYGFVRGPMVGIQVRARSMRDGSASIAYSDCNGQYILTDVRYGPNEIFLERNDAGALSSGVDYSPCGGLVTDKNNFQQARQYFVDVIEEEDSLLNMEMRQRADFVEKTIAVKVFDNLLPREPIVGARVDLYSDDGPDYRYVGTLFTDDRGLATFYRRPRKVTPGPTHTPTSTPTSTPTPTSAPGVPTNTPLPTPGPPEPTPTPRNTATPRGGQFWTPAPQSTPPTPTPPGDPTFTPSPTPTTQFIPTPTSGFLSTPTPVDPDFGTIAIGQYSLLPFRVEISAPGFINVSHDFYVGYYAPNPYVEEVTLSPLGN